jgi:hypothetical protein
MIYTNPIMTKTLSLTGSLDQLAHGSRHLPKVVEHQDVPVVWDRPPQSGYTGRRMSGVYGNEKSQYRQNAPFNSYGMGRPLPSYEIPQRYGKSRSYQEELPIPLAGNNNTWVPDISRRKRIWGMERWAFWLILMTSCLLVIGVVGGLIAGLSSASRRTSV